MSSKASRLKNILTRAETGYFMEAHNGASALISEQAGFDGLWASGLSMSTAMGVRDNNELSWSQVLDQLEFMADASTLPILVDGDTGFGNFNTFRRLVRKLTMRGIAGVCIEDKTFPKTNSFLGENQALAPIQEFAGKIRAGKDAQTDPDFCIVARVEALISGRPMEEALQRADAYAEAGADAIVIHSRKADPDEILEFMARWDRRVPIILIPTKYYKTPTQELADAGASAFVWANHNLRASLQAMKTTTETIARTKSLIEVEPVVYPLHDVFALTGNDELEAAEKIYEPTATRGGAILLAASRGEELGELTADCPKCMVTVRGETILSRHLAALRRAGVGHATVVGGYKAETISAPETTVVVNDAYESTGEAQSLALASSALSGPTVIGYGDIVFEPFFADLLFARDAEATILVDPSSAAEASADDRVLCTPAFEPGLGTPERVTLERIGAGVDPSAAGAAQWIGLMALNISGARKVRQILEQMESDGSLATANMSDVVNALMATGTSVDVVPISGNWRNVNSLLDLAEARDAA